MSFTPDYTGSFKKDYKLIKSRGYDILRLKKAIDILLEKGKLPKGFKPHPLISNYKEYMGCYIKNNWFLLWKMNHTEKTIVFTRTGTHTDLF